MFRAGGFAGSRIAGPILGRRSLFIVPPASNGAGAKAISGGNINGSSFNKLKETKAITASPEVAAARCRGLAPSGAGGRFVLP